MYGIDAIVALNEVAASNERKRRLARLGKIADQVKEEATTES
jgi:hypothetical protein